MRAELNGLNASDREEKLPVVKAFEIVFRNHIGSKGRQKNGANGSSFAKQPQPSCLKLQNRGRGSWPSWLHKLGLQDNVHVVFSKSFTGLKMSEESCRFLFLGCSAAKLSVVAEVHGQPAPQFPF
jgi:hypothetical protein